MAKKAKIGECAYCGEVRPLTKDDVIPKCLFPKPRPSNLVKVPACLRCNNEKSKTDDYLRDFLVADAYSSDNETAQALAHGEMLRSVRQNSSAFAKTAIQNAKPQPLFTPGGIYLGEILSFPIEGEQIFPRIVRGLYYKVFTRRIPDDYTFEVRRVDPFRFDENLADGLRVNHFGPYHIGNKEFICLFLCSSEDLFSTIWLMWFYGSIGFYVITEPPADAKASAA